MTGEQEVVFTSQALKIALYFNINTFTTSTLALFTDLILDKINFCLQI